MTDSSSSARSSIEPPDIVIVSDLHLGRTRNDQDRRASHDRDSAFARFTSALLERAAGAGRDARLVLLGDTFELPAHAADADPDPPAGIGATSHSRDGLAARWADAAERELERIGDGRRDAFDAVTSVLAGGATVDVVAGNHDAALQLPAVQDRVRALLGGYRGQSLAFHPWILHWPGMLYAEHGHQYHDITAYPMALRPGPLGSAVGLPLLERVDDVRAALRPESSAGLPRRLARAGTGLVAELARLSVPPLRSGRRAAYRRDVLPAYAESIDLPIETLLAIDQLSEPTTWSIAARISRQAIGGRRESGRSRTGYLGQAAEAIHAVLTHAGRAVPVYAFGHSHTPAVEPLPLSRPTTHYANAGSWARIRPTELRRSVGPGRFALVWIRPEFGAPPDVRLLAWDDLAGRFDEFRLERNRR